MDFLAHISEDNRTQSVQDHLTGTAVLCSQFAAAFRACNHGYFAGMAHDIGKCSLAFQRRLYGGPKVDHAAAGAIECAKRNFIYAACAVLGHHGGLPDLGNPRTDQPGDPTCFGRLKKGIAGAIEPCFWNGTLPDPGQLPEFHGDPLAMSFWTRMLYSCLVDADFLDTERFLRGNVSQHGYYDAMDTLLRRFEEYITRWKDLSGRLDRCRCQILQNCLDKGVSPKGLYSLTVPTGGGKTTASLAFALRHAVAHGMKRILYVIPYTSVIEQNAEVFRQIFGTKNVIEHHSGIAYDPNTEISPEQRSQLLAAENWDAPVIVTTAVQFFESMYSNRASQCRKLHNIADSVIIFDEVQMIPTSHLRPCVAAIAHLVQHFHSSAVLCTATQPFLNDLFQEFIPALSPVELCPESELLFKSFRRVTFRQWGKITNEQLARKLLDHHQVLCIVNSRKAAQEIYSLIPSEGRFHLSTLMYPVHRQQILAQIRRRLKDGQECRVVSTSLIEAGVDVDFPSVYREKAGLDAIIQAAGRCNREGKRPVSDSIVSIFEGEEPPPPLFRINIGAAAEALSNHADPEDPETIRCYFKSLRSFIGNNTDKAHIVDAFQRGISGCYMPFRTAAERFHLIGPNTKTVYIPLEDGVTSIRRILDKSAARNDYRIAGRYSVAIYEEHYNMLLDSGALIPLTDDSAVLKDLNLYRKDVGLSLEADSGAVLFV